MPRGLNRAELFVVLPVLSLGLMLSWGDHIIRPLQLQLLDYQIRMTLVGFNLPTAVRAPNHAVEDTALRLLLDPNWPGSGTSRDRRGPHALGLDIKS